MNIRRHGCGVGTHLRAYAGVREGHIRSGEEIEMTAAVARAVRFDRYGGRDVLYVTEIDMPPG